MLADDQKRQLVSTFRDWIESVVGARLEAGAPERFDRDDARTLLTRWSLEPHFWHEITIRPLLPQVRVGLMTDDRLRSRDFREMVEAGGYTLSEFVAMGCESAGLHWPDPPVEHYREQGDRFRFATPVDLPSIEQLADESFRDRIFRLSIAYDRAFRGTAAG